jgi:hypothetical protein
LISREDNLAQDWWKRALGLTFAGTVLGMAVWQAARTRANPFPLAAPAGRDSNAKAVGAAGAVNQGAFDMSAWKYGPTFNAPRERRLEPGQDQIDAGRKWSAERSPGVSTQPVLRHGKCGYDFTWTEMQHAPRHGIGWRALAHCPNAKAVRACASPIRTSGKSSMHGYRRARARRADGRYGARSARGRALGHVPTAGRQSLGGGRRSIRTCGATFRRLSQHDQRQSGHHRDDRNARGPQERRRDRQSAGHQRGVRRKQRFGNFSGYKQGDPDYERAINIVHDAAIKAGKRLCGPFAWKDRPDFTCFQAETKSLPSRAASKPSLATWRKRRPSRKWGRCECAITSSRRR